jgi:Cu-Zn family superoxide dismutase
MRTTVAVILGTVVLTGGLAACAPSDRASTQTGTVQTSTTATTTATTTASTTASSAAPLASTAFAAPAESGTQPTGVTYNAELVPVGSKASVAVNASGGQNRIELTASGLLPGHMYGAHVHTKPCGAKPADSGPHYQDRKDPVTPSVDPAFANPENEVWLDLTTDAEGKATSTATVKWAFRAGEANAVVIHAAHTSSEPGKAGTAGDRLACLTAKF